MSFDHTPLDAFTGILASRGDRPAIVRGSHGVSFADLDRMARTCGPAFADRQTGVVLAARNSAEVAALVLAAWRVGAYPVFVSPSAPAGHVQRARELTGALLVVHEEGQDGPEPRLPPAPVLPPGAEGKVVHAGAGVCLGYVNDPERTARTRRTIRVDGKEMPAIFTGDIGRMDADGYLTLVGRRDRLIKTMDVRVSLDDVEKQLGAAGVVERIATVDVPDRILGRKIVAFVVPAKGMGLAEIRAAARARLSRFQLPRAFHLVDARPATASGKTDYRRLQKMAQGDA